MRDYSAAGLVFEDVLDQVFGVERYHYHGGLVRLAKGYGLWDMVDYKAALGHLSASRKELSVDFENPAFADRSSALLNRLGENQPFFGKFMPPRVYTGTVGQFWAGRCQKQRQ